MDLLLALATPVVSWAIWLSWTVARTSTRLARLEHMHDNPEEFGFGTSRTNQLIEDNTRAMQALTHYIRWVIENQSGERPPPPTPGA